MGQVVLTDQFEQARMARGSFGLEPFLREKSHGTSNECWAREQVRPQQTLSWEHGKTVPFLGISFNIARCKAVYFAQMSEKVCAAPQRVVYGLGKHRISV